MRNIVLAVVAVMVLQHPTVGFAEAVIVEFSSDPLAPRGSDPLFALRGPGAWQFVYEAGSAPRFPGDHTGSLTVTYDSLEPTSRLYTSLGDALTGDDDFVFGAVLTIRPEGFAADPFGFHPIALSLFNSTTTGDDRTGDLSDFRADTFDTAEFAYFPNVSPFFGGPYLSPDLFGESVAPDAFANFSFGTVPFELRPGLTYLVEMEHSAASRTLTAQVSIVRSDGRAVALPGGRVEVDLSGITGFLVDSLGLPAYHDGFNEFSLSGRSLMATVDYDLLYCARLEEGHRPADLNRALRRLRRPGRLTSTAPLSR
ncbi:MAG TPA: hypothetical protein VGK94_11330 [Candidatus Polarisedimenticolia bacterium]|jgi:hypothetical protein